MDLSGFFRTPITPECIYIVDIQGVLKTALDLIGLTIE